MFIVLVVVGGYPAIISQKAAQSLQPSQAQPEGHPPRLCLMLTFTAPFTLLSS